ncbi:MAG TPA: AMP-binding protein, partial [Verrucomicrobiae bacterium]|nr:AMP-binding protein [Verrucomicrobiae bacterium]
HDSFFELGGHSLLATQMLARLRDRCGVTVSLRALFQTPTVAGLALLVAQRKAEGADAAEELPALLPEPAERLEPFALTDVQQAYWVGRSNALELGSVASHIYFEVDLLDLEVGRLTTAFRRLIEERHDTLRTVVRPDGRQQVLPEVPPYEIAVDDLRGGTLGAAAAALEATRGRMSHQVLPADRWPLFEVHASRLDDRRTRLHVSFDLLLADALSLQILLAELVQLYRQPAAELAPLEITFRDYVKAEGELRRSPVYRRAQEYWLRRLDTLPAAPALPLAREPSALDRVRFARRRGRLEADAWARLKQRAAAAGLTPSGVLVAVYAEVLNGWSHQPRFTLNLTTFNRLPLHPQVNDLVGDFTSVTLLEVDHREPASFEARARTLQEQLWADLDHRYVSGVQVLRELARRRGGAAGALMPVVFTSVLNLPRGTETPGLEGDETGYAITQTPQVWLDHQVMERVGALVFNWDAVEDLFPAGTLDAMFAAYCALLERLAMDPAAWDVPVGLLAPADDLAARLAANATDAPVTDDLLHTLFHAQAAGQPDHPCVVTPERTLSYGDVARAATVLATELRSRGVVPNTLVALCLPKGWAQVVGALGILEAGAAYLPIDPALPAARQAHLLRHGEVSLVLTAPGMELPLPDGVTALVLDETLLAAPAATPLAPIQSADDLAYVIYTSGSTGTPKGVMVAHRGAVNTCRDLNTRWHVGPADRVLGLSAFNFDLSVYDCFGTLAAGATLVLPAPSPVPDPAHWLACVRTHGVTLWNSVPALAELLVEQAGETPLSSLRLVWLSGDWIPLGLPARLQALA